MPDIDANQMLLDIEAIKQLKARYFRYVDTKQWDDLKALFTADARWSVDGGSGHYEWDVPEEFIAHVSKPESTDGFVGSTVWGRVAAGLVRVCGPARFGACRAGARGWCGWWRVGWCCAAPGAQRRVR